MNSQWILGAMLGLVVFMAGLRGTRWAIRRVSRRPAATLEGTWQRRVARRSASDARRFEGNVYYFISSGIIGLCAAIAAVLSLAPVWIGLLGLFMALLASASAEALIRYGNANLAALSRTMRGWIQGFSD
jgi:hypothetical protein